MTEVHRYVKYSGKTHLNKDGHEIHEHRMVKCQWCKQPDVGPLCSVCGRAEGCPDDYGGDVPMGPIVVCEGCAKQVCPVCYDDHDCCHQEGA